MRQINIILTTARSASGAYVQPEMKVWTAREIRHTGKGAIRSQTVAVSREVEDLEELFPTAHNEHRHMVNSKTGHCTNPRCWRFDHGA